ncbi:MAG: isoprenylcysteine carboxylmethyltransferase family protein [Tepidiformaceae bacterium]
MIRFLVCCAMGAARLAELALSKRNMRRSGAAPPASRDPEYVLIVAVHTTTIAGTFVFGRGSPRWGWVALLAAVQPLRAWVIATLGDRWNTHGIVPASLKVETRGPYRYIRHPNYAVICVELLALPFAFRAGWLGVFASVANAALLRSRISREEAALMQIPEYRAHFEERARFIPGVF